MLPVLEAQCLLQERRARQGSVIVDWRFGVDILEVSQEVLDESEPYCFSLTLEIYIK